MRAYSTFILAGLLLGGSFLHVTGASAEQL
jgi:hypothetical protein